MSQNCSDCIDKLLRLLYTKNRTENGNSNISMQNNIAATKALDIITIKLIF